MNLWSVHNGAGDEPHPVHIHVNHFQVLSFVATTDQSLDDWGIELYEWRDSIPALYGTTMIKFRAHTFPGEIVMHCHMLAHEDRGLMSTFLILPERTACEEDPCGQ